MDASKPGKGILASLEHRKGSAPPHVAAAKAHGPALVVGSGLLVGLVLTWWVYSAPAPAHRDAVPPPVLHYEAAQARAPAPLPAEEAAAIIDEALPPAAPPAIAAALPPATVASVTIRRERIPVAKPQQKIVRRENATPAGRVTPDSDVALLAALVAHANDGDVVEPRLADSTASLLQRCVRVGGEEGRLCRVRICATRTTDPECGAN